MKKKDKEYKDLQGLLVSLDMEINLIQQDLEFIEKHLKTLIGIKDSLEYNVEFLKKSGVVVKIESYYDSVSQLVTIKTKIQNQNSSRNKLHNSLRKKQESYKYYLDQFEQKSEYYNSENVVLLFKDTDEQKRNKV